MQGILSVAQAAQINDAMVSVQASLFSYLLCSWLLATLSDPSALEGSVVVAVGPDDTPPGQLIDSYPSFTRGLSRTVPTNLDSSASPR